MASGHGSSTLRHKFAMFTREQAQAIVAYLELMRDRDELCGPDIAQALANYWKERGNPGGRP
jgi:hypothetical protein